MMFVLKISAQGEMHRASFEGVPDFASVRAAVAKRFPSWHTYALKYKDDEGDFCTLVESTFEDFLTTAVPATGDINSHACVLKLELRPTRTSSATIDSPPSLAASLRRNARKKQQVARNEWASDPRDLEELVQQLADPVIQKKTRKKKSKPIPKCGQASTASPPEFGEQLVEEEAQHDEDGDAMDLQDLCQKSVEIAVGGNVMGQSLTQAADPCTDQISENHQECETDDELLWEERCDGMNYMKYDANESAPRETLHRSASCPCIPTWVVEQEKDSNGCGQNKTGSLVAQAWPFVEEDGLPPWDSVSELNVGTAKLANLQGQGDVASCSDHGTMQQSNLLTCGQVLWMPVLLPWPINDPLAVPHMNMTVPMATCH